MWDNECDSGAIGGNVVSNRRLRCCDNNTGNAALTMPCAVAFISLATVMPNGHATHLPFSHFCECLEILAVCSKRNETILKENREMNSNKSETARRFGRKILWMLEPTAVERFLRFVLVLYSCSSLPLNVHACAYRVPCGGSLLFFFFFWDFWNAKSEWKSLELK